MRRATINPPKQGDPIVPDVIALMLAAVHKVPGTRTQYSIEHIYKLASLGCTQEEVAFFYGIAKEQFESTLRNDDILRRAWVQGHSNARISLRRLQLAHAQTPGSAGVNMAIHMSKHLLGEKDEVKQVVQGADAGPVRMTFSFTGSTPVAE